MPSAACLVDGHPLAHPQSGHHTGAGGYAALAYADGMALQLPAFLTAMACAVLIQIGTNLHNDVRDFERGNDRA
jgi:1,4-dihydroxy-2-naphthoate octaprenyltransferase